VSEADPTEAPRASPAATFLFADIAGFTALTEARGDEHAAQLRADFRAAVNAELDRAVAASSASGDEAAVPKTKATSTMTPTMGRFTPAVMRCTAARPWPRGMSQRLTEPQRRTSRAGVPDRCFHVTPHRPGRRWGVTTRLRATT
jgi:class 3 adenylate cyclase